MMKKLLCGAIAFGLMGSMGVAQAQTKNSISGTTDFQVEIPEILVLYHWDMATLKFNEVAQVVNTNQKIEKTIATLPANNANVPIDTATVTTTSIPTGTELPNTLKVKLQNAWAVRSLSSGDVSLVVAIEDGALLHGGTDTKSKAVVVANSAKLNRAEGSPEPTVDKDNNGNAIDKPLKIVSRWKPTYGDINFNLDLSGVTKAGLHKTATTDVFRLTLTGNATKTP